MFIPSTSLTWRRDRFAGDGGLATQAILNFPSALVVDGAGALFIADTLNHRIRRVDPQTGIIQTVAGTGQTKWSGDGGPGISATLNEPVALALHGTNLYIADQSNNRTSWHSRFEQDVYLASRFPTDPSAAHNPRKNSSRASRLRR